MWNLVDTPFWLKMKEKDTPMHWVALNLRERKEGYGDVRWSSHQRWSEVMLLVARKKNQGCIAYLMS